jgi:hypothetical protein
MELNQLLAGFMKLQRRSEKASPEVLRKTFVKVGPLEDLITIIDNQALFGRRGTGKTHVLQFLASKQAEAGDFAVYVDLSNLGSSGSVYSDVNRPIAERATRLLVDTLLQIHDALFDAVVKSSTLDLSKFGPVLDNLRNAATRVRVVGTVAEQSQLGVELSQTQGGRNSFKVAPDDLAVSHTVFSEEKQVQNLQLSRKHDGVESYVLHFGEIAGVLKQLEELFGSKRLWLLLDEWSNLPLELQPYLGDLLRRSIFVIKQITVKIAAIEYRSHFMIRSTAGSYVGIELGADIAVNINLDDFMVFDNDVNRSAAFHRELLYNHLIEASGAISKADFPDPREMLRSSFSQENVFSELVRAGEGVPRDFINILSLAAQYSNGERISMNAVRKAALSWYQTGKANTLRAREDANKLLEWIIERVIKTRKTRAFLLNSQKPYALIDELFDARVLHVIKRRVSSNDLPGQRFDVFKLDYGCYVDLIGTASSPQALFQAELDSDAVTNVEVPRDDYRSIRRAILDIEEFEKRDTQK